MDWTINSQDPRVQNDIRILIARAIIELAQPEGGEGLTTPKQLKQLKLGQKIRAVISKQTQMQDYDPLEVTLLISSIQLKLATALDREHFANIGEMFQRVQS